MSIIKIIEDYNNKNLSREEFWKKCRDYHYFLKDYQKLIKIHYLDSIQINSDQLIIALANGLQFIWNPDDVRTAPSLIINMGEYEECERKLLELIASKSKGILDIGANIGWYSLHLHHVQPMGGKLYAFEAIKDTYNTLKVNVKINKTEDLILNNIALGEKEGNAIFYIPEETGSVAASRQNIFGGIENSRKEICKMVTLDSWVESNCVKNIDLIKCDVEGTELMVLKGCMSTIEKNKPIFFLEMLRKWSKIFKYHPNDVIEFLFKYNYDSYAIDNEINLIKLRKIKQVTDEEEATNFLFFNKDVHSKIISEIFNKNNIIIE